MQETITRRAALRAGAASAGLLAAGGLAACGSGDKTAATTAAPGKTQDVTLKYWTHDRVLSVPLMQYWAKVLSNEPNPPYRYTIKPSILPPETLPTKARAAFLAKSNAPDVMNILWTVFPQLMPIAQDTLVDLTDAVAAVRAQNLGNLWRTYSVDGRVYGLELSTSWMTYYYRDDEFKALGLPTSFDSWDDLLAIGQSKAVPKGKALGMVATAAPIHAAEWYVPYLLQRGGQVFNEDGSLALKSQEAVDALAFLVKAVQTEVFQALPFPEVGPGGIAIKTGRVIGTPGAEWYNKFILQPTVPDQKGKWRMAALPRFVPGGSQVSVLGGSCWCIAKDSPAAGAATELVKQALLTRVGQVKKLELENLFPTWKSVYDSPAMLGKVEPFLGGQNIGQLYADITRNDTPAVNQSPYMPQALTIISGEVVNAYKGVKSPQTAIADASAAIEAKINA